MDAAFVRGARNIHSRAKPSSSVPFCFPHRRFLALSHGASDSDIVLDTVITAIRMRSKSLWHLGFTCFSPDVSLPFSLRSAPGGYGFPILSLSKILNRGSSDSDPHSRRIMAAFESFAFATRYSGGIIYLYSRAMIYYQQWILWVHARVYVVCNYMNCKFIRSATFAHGGEYKLTISMYG